MRGFADQEWIQDLDFSTLKKVSEGFVSDRLDARWADMVWQVEFRESDHEVYLLLEFQSTIEPYMAVRWLPILGAFYQDQIRRLYPRQTTDESRQSTGETDETADPEDSNSPLPRLPMAIALVIYSGRPKWWPAQNLRHLIACPQGVDASLPVNICYSLLDLGRVPEGRLKQAGHNLVAALVRLERTESVADLSSQWGKLEKWIPSEYHSSYRLWLKAALQRMGFSEFVSLEGGDDREMTMFAENMRDYLEKSVQEAQHEGRIHGLITGRSEGLDLGRAEGLDLGRAEGLDLGRAEGLDVC